jgi:hypothetical protein
VIQKSSARRERFLTVWGLRCTRFIVLSIFVTLSCKVGFLFRVSNSQLSFSCENAFWRTSFFFNKIRMRAAFLSSSAKCSLVSFVSRNNNGWKSFSFLSKIIINSRGCVFKQKLKRMPFLLYLCTNNDSLR